MKQNNLLSADERLDEVATILVIAIKRAIKREKYKKKENSLDSFTTPSIHASDKKQNGML